MFATAILMTHVLTATVGLLSGTVAMFLRKGSGMHGAAGTIFTVSMLCMTSTGAYYATFIHPIGFNVIAGLLTFYLVATSWVAARKRDGGVGPFEIGAALWIIAVGVGSLMWGFEALSSSGRARGAAPIYFVFGAGALLCAISDARMLAAGTLDPRARMRRHLWRMCIAFLIALMSLYPGQARLFPKAWRETNVLFVPHILLSGSMIYWRVRYRARKAAASASDRTSIAQHATA